MVQQWAFGVWMDWIVESGRISDLLTYQRFFRLNSPVNNPIFRKRVNQIWTLLGQDVVDIPAAGYLALATRNGRVQAKKGHNIARVRMKDLLVICVRRSSDGSLLGGIAQILDVREHQRSAVRMTLVLLASTDVTHISADTCVDNDVLFARVGIHAQATQNEEALAEMKLF